MYIPIHRECDFHFFVYSLRRDLYVSQATLKLEILPFALIAAGITVVPTILHLVLNISLGKKTTPVSVTLNFSYRN
jgi:hypothetical protein